MTCSYRPEIAYGPIGMHHCPLCGEMVTAGFPHPDYDAMEAHLIRMAEIRFGDLVLLSGGHYGLVVDRLQDGKSPTVRVFCGNGQESDEPWTSVREVFTLPGSAAHVNFAERLAPESYSPTSCLDDPSLGLGSGSGDDEDIELDFGP